MARILVADDAALVRRVVCHSLQPHETVEAADGQEALALLRTWRPRVAILDWMMPGLSGLDVCQAARSDPSAARTIFVMMTARREQDAEHQARGAGIDHFLRKPVMPGELAELVAELLSSHEPVGDASSAQGGPAGARYKVKSDVSRNRLMIRADGRLTETVLNAIMAEASHELSHLEPGYVVWIDLRSTAFAGHAVGVHVQRLYTLVASASPSKVGTLVDDVTVQMQVTRASSQTTMHDAERTQVFTDEQEWLRFLRWRSANMPAHRTA